jgi:hypothetical protein
VPSPCSRLFRSGGSRPRSEKDAAFRTAALSSTDGATNSVTDISSARGSNGPNQRIWVRPKNRPASRAPQRKIIHLAEFFEAIWGVDGHEHVQIPGNR